MIKIENTKVDGFEAAIRGMRNPLNSHEKSDSGKCFKDIACHTCKINRNYCKQMQDNNEFVVGYNDYELMKKLVNAGTDHSKFMRMINVTIDITAPMYWWKEADTYKVGTVANSESTMHTIHKKEFNIDDFSNEHLDEDNYNLLKTIVARLNHYRDIYVNGGIIEYPDCGRKVFQPKDKDIWWQLIQVLPSSYNQKRTWQANYQVLRNIYHSRKNHKLDEWREFCKWVETLPYSELIIG